MPKEIGMKDVQEKTGVFLLTAETLVGYHIAEYYGLVNGQSVMGANFLKDYMAGIADKFGGRAKGYENALDGAVNVALEQMAMRAKEWGANAVIAIDVDTSGIHETMLMASCYGTAVLIEKIRR
jgi:uncharacterized protein YbjQ (UPF0145 family)